MCKYWKVNGFGKKKEGSQSHSSLKEVIQADKDIKEAKEELPC